jgi:hypothetical protein
VADRPDPEWVATLKEGDRVAVAEYGREIYEGVVRRVTPTGIIKVSHASSASEPIGGASAFNGPGSAMWRVPGYKRDAVYGRRYLVPPADAESLRTKGQP